MKFFQAKFEKFGLKKAKLTYVPQANPLGHNMVLWDQHCL